jgi:predicted O-methyltransferase YrrM
MADRGYLARRRLGGAALRLAGRLDRRHHISLEYPPTAEYRQRWGHGRPSHPQLTELLASHAGAYRATLEMIAGHRAALLEIPLRSSDPLEPHWLNAWQPGLDAAALYGFVRSREPARYVEVGSGMSTRFAARAVRDGATSTRITSIDPMPRNEIDSICDEIVRAPLESLDPQWFDGLSAGDVLFVDNSHRVFLNSDVTAFFLDVLPRLAHGVLVGVHDVMLPDDYLPEWSDWHFSEQYLLAAWLLGGAARMRPVLAAWYASVHGEAAGILAPLWGDPRMEGVDNRGFAFWFEVAE